MRNFIALVLATILAAPSSFAVTNNELIQSLVDNNNELIELVDQIQELENQVGEIQTEIDTNISARQNTAEVVIPLAVLTALGSYASIKKRVKTIGIVLGVFSGAFTVSGATAINTTTQNIKVARADLPELKDALDELKREKNKKIFINSALINKLEQSQ